MPQINTTRQFWIQSIGHGEIVSAELPPRLDGQVLVRTLYSGISRGTESLVFRGRVPQSQFQAMRAPFQDGEFPAPIKYGYMNVGRVEEGPEVLVGQTVFCLYPHQDLYCVPDSAVTVVPANVPPGRAILAANMQSAVNAVWDAGVSVGDHVVVIGAGVMGLLIAWVCRQLPGAHVVVIDIDPARETVARELGLTFLSQAPNATRADVVVHASGQPDGLVTALALAAVEATIVDVSWYGDTPVVLPLGEAFHSQRLTIRSSQVSRIPPDRVSRWSHARRAALAVELLADPALDLLITSESEFEDLPHVLATLSLDPPGALCHRVRYPDIQKSRN